MTSSLFGVTGTDPTTFAVTALLVLLVSVVASSLPALRGASVDPAIVLRAE